MQTGLRYYSSMPHAAVLDCDGLPACVLCMTAWLSKLIVIHEAQGLKADRYPQLICSGAEERSLLQLTSLEINAELIGALKYIAGVHLTIAAKRAALHSTFYVCIFSLVFHPPISVQEVAGDLTGLKIRKTRKSRIRFFDSFFSFGGNWPSRARFRGRFLDSF